MYMDPVTSKQNPMVKYLLKLKKKKARESEKRFLIEAAKRHTVFNYSKIADYYAHSSKEMQDLIEHSALVIIDFEKAIQYGYIKLNDEITNQFLNEYPNE